MERGGFGTSGVLTHGLSLDPSLRKPLYYGGTGPAPFLRTDPAKMPFEQRRKRVHFGAVLICFVVPCVQFVVNAAVLNFSVHYSSPWFTCIIVLACAFATLSCCVLAMNTVRNWFRGDYGRQPFWYIFLASTMCLAFCLSVWLGEANYWNNELPYNELTTMSTQTSVNVSSMPGRQLMDVGRVEFQEGTFLDLQKQMSFMNTVQYCVAPIAVGSEQKYMTSYDYWAVGMNCCGARWDGFRCGDYNSARARSGLRLMREDHRQYYELAVQQAVATYHIHVDHPLFFEWVEDPAADMERYRQESRRYYGLGVLSFVAAQVAMTVGAVIMFSVTKSS